MTDHLFRTKPGRFFSIFPVVALSRNSKTTLSHRTQCPSVFGQGWSIVLVSMAWNRKSPNTRTRDSNDNLWTIWHNWARNSPNKTGWASVFTSTGGWLSFVIVLRTDNADHKSQKFYGFADCRKKGHDSPGRKKARKIDERVACALTCILVDNIQSIIR